MGVGGEEGENKVGGALQSGAKQIRDQRGTMEDPATMGLKLVAAGTGQGCPMLPEPQPLNELHNEEEGEEKQIILSSKWTEQRQGIPHMYS